jgi:hypothetical protein
LFLHYVEIPVGYIYACRQIKVIEGLCSVRTWFDESVELAINEKDAAYKVWQDNIYRERGERLWVLYVWKRRYADGLVERNYGGFVSVYLDPRWTGGCQCP